MHDLLDLCREVTLQGAYNVEFDYSGTIDCVSVYIYDKSLWDSEDVGCKAKALVYRVNTVGINEELIPVIEKVKEHLK
jgi:hypothetical protein